MSKIRETGTSSLKVQERNKNKRFLFSLVKTVYHGNLLTYLSDSLPIYTNYVNSTQPYKTAVKVVIEGH